MLTRDYFGVSLGGAVLFSSLLYWVIAWFVTGILSTPVYRTLHLRIERIAQPVAQEIEREQRDAQRQAGKHDQPPVDLHRRDHLDAFVGQQAPRNVRRLDAQAEERQKRLEQHHARNRQREIHDHDAHQVRQDVPQMIRVWLAPIARAASTNGSVLSEITWPRTTRAIVSQ